MNIAVQYCNELNPEDIQKARFNSVEIRAGKANGLSNLTEKTKRAGFDVQGINVRLAEFCNGEKEVDIKGFQSVLQEIRKSEARYIIIETENVTNKSVLLTLIQECEHQILGLNIDFYIENGYVSVNSRFYHCDFSDVKKLKRMANDLNQKYHKDIFGVCVNVGHANLLGMNVKQMIKEIRGMKGLVHINDNDGQSDQHQMPYTFTTGRGVMSTDWFHIIGAIITTGFQGRIVFDLSGTFARTPKKLHLTMLKLMKAIENEWQNAASTEEYLAEPGKKIILFGAGKMAQNYMEAWGEKYRPEFLVDNNKEIQGSERWGIPVKSPEAILEIPEQERNVWICNLYYDEIGVQLERMGIAYRCYWDHYFL